MKNPLWNNWQAKLISFIIALLIWVYVKNLVEQGFIDQLLTGTLSTGR
jgi:YbbR domain-containing protein